MFLSSFDLNIVLKQYLLLIDHYLISENVLAVIILYYVYVWIEFEYFECSIDHKINSQSFLRKNYLPSSY